MQPTPDRIQRPADPRTEAARILCDWLERGDFPDRMLERVTDGRAFVMEVVYGVVRHFAVLKWVVSSCVPEPPRPQVMAVLLAGLYELLFMENAEPYATVNETVESARRFAGGRSAGFVNAVLRRAQREKADMLALIPDLPPALRLSHPAELFDRWAAAWGETRAIALCEWDNRRAETCVRVHAGRTTLADLQARFRAAGCAAEPHPYDPARFLRLPRGSNPAVLPGFREGHFYAQDPSTALAPDRLAVRPGEVVLDACAAPGGKTLLLAERLRREGVLVALELHADRRARLVENLKRMGADWVRVHTGDAGRTMLAELADLSPGCRDGFDAILLDVPCTNTGVIRRRPDARWAFSAERLRLLCARQRAILEHAATLLKPGGRIVYSTCSFEPEEDEEQIRGFLTRNRNFKPAGDAKLYPPDTGTDGAYAALLRSTAAG